MRGAKNHRFERGLRQSQTDAERQLWSHLRDRRLGGWKFRRQHPIGSYVLDFVCLEVGLVVELDGGQHQDAQPYDQARTAFLNKRGLRVLRFWDGEALDETEAVLSRILEELMSASPPHPLPLPAGGARGQGAGLSPSPPERGERAGVRGTENTA
jgi:very-short-patch-repair endonuclease